AFFFQAEDGIRCRNVTGVQTCALPICCCGFAGDRGMLHPELTASATAGQADEIARLETEHGRFDAYLSANRTCEMGMSRATDRRSEERSVGEECTSRRERDHGES